MFPRIGVEVVTLWHHAILGQFGIFYSEICGHLRVTACLMNASMMAIRTARSSPAHKGGKMAQEPTTTATTTNFLLNTTTPAGLGTDNFILQVTGFTRNGVPVSVPGLGSTFGLYLEGTVSVQGTPSVYSPGTVALVLDPTNNDGTPGATWDPATQSGSIGFSNLVNTADDITLATGSFVSGAFGIQSNGQPGVNFVQTLDLNPAIFGPNSGTNLNISETLFNTATSRLAGTTTAGGSYITANDGYGTINLTQTSVVGDHSPSFCGGRTASQILAEPRHFGVVRRQPKSGHSRDRR
jgi:hypothetical protein